MDIPASAAYLANMLGRLVAMLAILAITVVTTVTSFHAARMSMGPASDHAAHMGEIMHSADRAQPDCDGEQHCGSANAEMCAFVCAGLPAFLPPSGAATGHSRGHARHDFPPETSLVGRAPALHERPPQLRLS